MGLRLFGPYTSMPEFAPTPIVYLRMARKRFSTTGNVSFTFHFLSLLDARSDDKVFPISFVFPTSGDADGDYILRAVVSPVPFFSRTFLENVLYDFLSHYDQIFFSPRSRLP